MGWYEARSRNHALPGPLGLDLSGSIHEFDNGHALLIGDARWVFCVAIAMGLFGAAV